jgi:hypothetical protein
VVKSGSIIITVGRFSKKREALSSIGKTNCFKKAEAPAYLEASGASSCEELERIENENLFDLTNYDLIITRLYDNGLKEAWESG